MCMLYSGDSPSTAAVREAVQSTLTRSVYTTLVFTCSTARILLLSTYIYINYIMYTLSLMYMPMSQEPAGADAVPAGHHAAREGGGRQLQTAAGKRA